MSNVDWEGDYPAVSRATASCFAHRSHSGRPAGEHEQHSKVFEDISTTLDIEYLVETEHGVQLNHLGMVSSNLQAELGSLTYDVLCIEA